MGKVRIKKEAKKKAIKAGGAGHSDISLKNTVGKLQSDIEAISLGPPRSKILKKTTPSSSSGGLTTNFASRINVLNKQKKKVRFCQNLVAEELKEQKASSQDAKHYFKVIHPSAIEKRIREGGGAKPTGSKGTEPTKATSLLGSIIPDSEVLMSIPSRALRKVIKSSARKKKTILKARKESFKKKMELLKTKEEEQTKMKQRQQTVIVGDMHPILHALPDLTSNEDDKPGTDVVAKKEEKSKVVPNKTKYTMKKTQQAILESLKFFEASGVTVGMGLPKT